MHGNKQICYTAHVRKETTVNHGVTKQSVSLLTSKGYAHEAVKRTYILYYAALLKFVLLL